MSLRLFLLCIFINFTFVSMAGIEERGESYWGVFPLHVRLVGLDDCRALRMFEAVNRWNWELSLLGYDGLVFDIDYTERVDISGEGYIWVFEEDLPSGDTTLLGNCSLGYKGKGGRLYGAVITLSKDYCSVRVAMHELGHALGLSHSSDWCIDCVMNAIVPWHEGKVVEGGILQRKELYYIREQLINGGVNRMSRF